MNTTHKILSTNIKYTIVTQIKRILWDAIRYSRICLATLTADKRHKAHFKQRFSPGLEFIDLKIPNPEAAGSNPAGSTTVKPSFKSFIVPLEKKLKRYNHSIPAKQNIHASG